MTESARSTAYSGLEVAIIGMAGRFPGAAGLDAYWQLLIDGVDAVRYLTDEELERGGVDPAEFQSPRYVRAYRSFDGADLFDASFFSIGPREAEVIDPQHRVLLECAWETLENAGYDPERFPGQVGVFAGSRIGSYLMNVYSNPQVLRTAGDLLVQTSNDKDYLATRISYKLNLGGPSVTVQSACSTALVAVHLGCQALLAGECELALAGGVSVRIPEVGYPYREGELASPDGMVRAFDVKASGTVFSSGLGMVLLKRLEDALADGDQVRAVIKGSAVTNDGSRKVGFTAPGVDGQARVLRAAQMVGEVDPASIGYIEAHGTGTPLGDPIEVTALTQVFREHTDRTQFCALGSVKTNVGHLGAAAGAAGLIKTVLALEHEVIPPSLHFEEPNPEIDFEASPFFVVREPHPWPRDGRPRRAGVSAFGIGGTNAHVILEEAPVREPSGPSRPWQLLPLSARTPTALEAASERLGAHLEAHPELPLADVAHTLQVGRKAMEHRRTVVCRDRGEAVAALRGEASDRLATGYVEGKDRPVVFMFSGQGAQYPGMGADLYRDEPAFREAVDRCSEVLRPHLDLDLRPLLFPADEELEAAGERLAQTALTQPALFTVEYALAEMWRSWGVRPAAMIGHSIGEYVAACVAGVFTLEDALAVVAARGRLMQSLPAGAMLAVPLAEEEVLARLGSQLSLAAVNAPKRCVVSGPEAAVEDLRLRFEADGVPCRPLHTSHAFHSDMMEPILSPFREVFAGVALAPPEIPYVSNVTGTWIEEGQATDPGYWATHLRSAVRFADGLAELARERRRAFLEVGPGRTLATLARQNPDRDPSQPVVASLRHPKDGGDDLAVALRSLGELWLGGGAVDWPSLAAGERRQRVALPTYPFERRRYWVDMADLALTGAARQSLRKRQDIADWFYMPFWKPSLPAAAPADEVLAASRYLVFADRGGLGDALARRLEGAGTEVFTVRPGEGFTRDGERSFTVGPRRREDYESLLGALVEAGGLPDRVAHLWSVGDAVGEPLAAAGSAEELGFWSLLAFAQAFGRQSSAGPLQLVVASDGLRRVHGEATVRPEKATLLGPVKTIPLEFAQVRAASVDFPHGGGTEDGFAGWVERLLGELHAPEDEPAVAYRAGLRWLLDYQPIRPGSPGPGKLRLRDGGVYLLTGGYGGIGLTLAEHLAVEHRARLVLVGITGLPEREEWDTYLTKVAPGERTAERIRAIRRMEEAGAEVLPLVADVGDLDQVRRAVGRAVERFGTLHGVVHAAGLPGAGVIQLKKSEAAAAVLAPKVTGTLVLEEALRGIDLDFLLLCSSTIAVLGGPGQVDYCAANSFLDAFAHSQAAAGGPPTVSLNWGAWEEVGMAVDSGLVARREAFEEVPPDAVDHPILRERRIENPVRTHYFAELGAEEQWVLNEHRILGTPTLPGTTYLELARAAAAVELGGGDTFALEDVLFFTPLMVPDGAMRSFRLTLDRVGEGFRFRAASRPGGSSEPWQDHAQGRIRALSGAVADRLDLAAIRDRSQLSEVDMSMLEEGIEHRLVAWGPHWAGLRQVWAGEHEGLARVEMPVEYVSELAELGLHPALLDVATGIASLIKGQTFLPLSYRRVEMLRPLAESFTSYIRLTDDREGKETLTADIHLVDDDGNELVRIEQFAMKRVGDAAKRLDFQETAVASPPRSAPAPTAQARTVTGGILPSEGLEAFRRVLSQDWQVPQLVVTTKDLHGLLAQVTAVAESRGESAAGAGRGERLERHPRPNLSTPYVEPATPEEEKLVEIWQAAMGLDQVGVQDNFFDLGGDSIVGLQLIARANEAGFELTPDQLFEYQTIHELARLVASSGEAGRAAPAELEAAVDADGEDSGLSEDELEKVFSKLREMDG